MKKKLLLILGSFVVLFFTAAIALPILFKDTIITKVKETINSNLTAKVDFADFNISIFRNFPNLSFGLEELTVVGTDSFATDTLANIRELVVVVDVMSVISGDQIKIKSFKLDEPKIYAKVLPSGKANWDIAKPDTGKAEADTAATPFKIALKKYSLEKGTITYDDASLGFYIKLENLNHTGTGDFTQDLFTLETHSFSDAVTMKYGGVTYLSKAKLDAKVPMEMDMPNFKFTFKDNEFKLNELFLKFAGFIAMPADDIAMDIKFDAEKSEFKNFLSLVPAVYASDFEKLSASGKFAMNGFAKGVYSDKSMPAFALNLLIENGNFKYPDLPTGVNNVQLKTGISNADGNPDHTVVEVSKLHVEFGKEPFDAKLLLKMPLSDPDINTEVKGKVDLGQLTSIVPLEDMKLSGIITADVKAAGKMSSIEQQHYEQFHAAGQVAVTNLVYETKGLPKVNIPQSQMFFSPKNISLVTFTAKVGKSDFNATGTLDNYLAYALKNDPIAGKLNLTSSLVDVNELMGPEETAAQQTKDTSKLSVVEVSANVHFVLNSDIKRVLYDNMDIENLKGQIVVRNSTLSMENATMNMLDGKVTASGYYNTSDIKKPKVDFAFGIENMNIQKAFNTFNTVQKLAPAGKYTTGAFSTKMSFQSELGADMMPVMNSIAGEGTLILVKAVVEGFEPLNKLSDAIKVDKYKRLELNNVKLNFRFEEGRVKVEPFDIKQGTFVMNIGGSNGFDQTIDYVAKLTLPRKELGSVANTVVNTLTGELAKAGGNLTLGENISVNALIGGTVMKPTVKLSMGDVGKSVKDAVKEAIDAKKKELEEKAKAEVEKAKAQATAEARAKADKILAEAQAKADALKNEAGKLADKTKNEGYAAAKRLEEEASNPIAKVAAKKAAEKLRKESDEKAQKIRDEGNSKANGIMDAARAEANKLLGGK